MKRSIVLVLTACLTLTACGPDKSEDAVPEASAVPSVHSLPPQKHGVVGTAPKVSHKPSVKPSRKPTHRVTTPPVEAPEPQTRIVHAGSFCSPRGATGETSRGTRMICGTGSDGKLRWKSA